MARSHSAPPEGAGDAAINPFYSERAQTDLRLEAARPSALPQQQLSPDAPLAPLRDGKGRGAVALEPLRSNGAACFVTPPSNRVGQRDDSAMHGDLQGQATGQQTEGRMPTEGEATVKSMGPAPPAANLAELQRALEVEVVNQLGEQNAKLLAELEFLRENQHRPPSSTQSSLKLASKLLLDMWVFRRCMILVCEKGMILLEAVSA